MSHTPKLTMIGLYNYYDDVFVNLKLPDGVEKQTVIDTFLLEHGESPLLYANGDFVKAVIGIWSRKWYNSIERLISAMADEYNPLHNFDRNEVYTDIEKILNQKNTDTTSNTESANSRVTKDNLDENIKSNEVYTGTLENNTEGTTENTVSAYNADTYQPDTKQINEQSNTTNDNHTTKGNNDRNVKGTTNDDYTGTDKTDGNIKEDGQTDRELEHTAHLYGNIGVTTSQQMLEAEVNLRKNINIYSVISELLYRELCIYTY